MITDGCRFCNIKETDNNHSRWQSFQYRFNSSVEIVCNQLNFNCKIILFSRILAEFLVYAIIRLIRISAEFFPSQPSVFFQIADLRSNRYRTLSDIVKRDSGAASARLSGRALVLVRQAVRHSGRQNHPCVSRCASSLFDKSEDRQPRRFHAVEVLDTVQAVAAATDRQRGTLPSTINISLGCIWLPIYHRLTSV